MSRSPNLPTVVNLPRLITVGKLGEREIEALLQYARDAHQNVIVEGIGASFRVLLLTVVGQSLAREELTQMLLLLEPGAQLLHEALLGQLLGQQCRLTDVALLKRRGRWIDRACALQHEETTLRVTRGERQIAITLIVGGNHTRNNLLIGIAL